MTSTEYRVPTAEEIAAVTNGHFLEEAARVDLRLRDGRWIIALATTGADDALDSIDGSVNRFQCECGDPAACADAAEMADQFAYLPSLRELHQLIGQALADYDEDAAWEENRRRDDPRSDEPRRS